MNYKKAFYSKLEDCYLGVKIKDFHKGNTAKNGFSNLLKIKEQYFAHIKAYLESQIESEPLSHDIYNKLFTFFDSYLNESGTPFFNDTPIYKNIYAKVYSNSKDTSLFYKTQNLYYVKSDILYQSLTLSDEQENYEVVFDASEYQQNADNTKNKVLFKLDSISCNELARADEESPNQITIKVINHKDLFPELNNVFKQNSSEFSDDFLKSLKQKKLKFNEENLKKIFRSYKKQSEIDFFIHKNAKAFLQEQFDLWMFHYLYQESEIQEWNPQIIAHLQKIKNIAYEIIKLIAAFENELKAIWLKPKFAKKTEYVFSVDTILQYANNANALIESIANDKGFEPQIKEWQELKLIDDSNPKDKDTIISNSLTDRATSHSPSLAEGVRGWVQSLIESDKYRYLPIDTKHFSKETKYKILSSFDELESLLNGELIKSDNFQALNTLMPKYQSKVDLIYIDPPFNTGSDFEYKDKFQDSTWLSLMENRLELAMELLSNRGSFYLHLDHNANYRGRELLNNIFGEENFRNEIVWRRKQATSFGDNYFGIVIDTILLYSKTDNSIFYSQKSLDDENTQKYIKERFKFDDGDGRKYMKSPLVNSLYRPNLKYIFQGIKPPHNGWLYSKEKMQEFFDNGELLIPKDENARIYRKIFLDTYEGQEIPNIWLDIPIVNPMAMERIEFETNLTQKPEALLQRIVKASSNQDSIILDYHLGSGTTLAVAQKLGRKWLGIEMGEHFYNVVIPRLKKVIAGFQSGISKECDYQGGGAFRYYELESYEEALNHCEYVLKDSYHRKPSLCHSEPALAGEESHKLKQQEPYKGKDYATTEAILDYRKSRKLIDKLNKGEIVSLDMRTEYRQDFDIFQTIANLMGWRIKRLFLDSKGIESCEFGNGEILNLDSIDLAKYPKLKNLIWWE